MNPLLWLAGGGVAAYLWVRRGEASAATLPAVSPAPGVPPSQSAGTVIVVPAPASAPTVSAPAASTPAPPPRSPPLIATRPAQPSPEVAAPKPSATIVRLNGRWGWPVPRWQGRAPVISDGFASPRPGMKHMGVDLMFTRIGSDPFPKGPNGTKAFVMPDAWMAVAAADGVLWSSGHTPRGYAVVVDHGTVATFYTHLDTLFVPEVRPVSRPGEATQVRIRAGQPLGVIGSDPMDPQRLKHLHFELWAGGPEQAVDPQALMKSWEVFTPTDIAPFLPGLQQVRNAKPKGQRSADGLVYVHDYYRRAPGTALNFAP